jgi:hypothetical protein
MANMQKGIIHIDVLTSDVYTFSREFPPCEDIFHREFEAFGRRSFR